MPKSVMRKVANGAAWMVLFKFVERSLGLISTLVLVRVLSPSDFGIVAMAVAAIAMVELLTAFGFDTALIHDQQASRAHYDSAWTLGLALGASVTALMLLVAPYVAAYFRQADVLWVICALSLVPLLRALENIGIVAFRKDLRFRSEFVFQLSRKLVAVSVTIPLAFALRNYWALVAGILASHLFSTAASYWVHEFRPRPSLSRSRDLFRFSKWLLVNNIVGFLKERSADFIIGRTRGAADLGLYNVSYELAHLPTTEIGAPINRALLPGFSKSVDQPGALEQMYRSAISLLALFAIPAAAGLYALAHLIVPVVLGEKWLAAVPVMQLLAFNGMLLLIQGSICTLLIGAGYPQAVVACNATYVGLLLVLLAVLTPEHGVAGAAAACLATSTAMMPIYLLAVARSLNLQARLFASAVVRPVAASVLMILTLGLLIPPEADFRTNWVGSLWLMWGIAFGASVYSVALLLLWWAVGRPGGGEALVIERLTEIVRTRLRRRPVPGA